MPNKTDKLIKMKNIRLWAWILMVCLFTGCSNNEDNIVDDFPPLEEEGMISDIEGDILIKPTGGQQVRLKMVMALKRHGMGIPIRPIITILFGEQEPNSL